MIVEIGRSFRLLLCLPQAGSQPARYNKRSALPGSPLACPDGQLREDRSSGKRGFDRNLVPLNDRLRSLNLS